VLIGAAVFLSARRMLFDQVNDDLVARAERESIPLVERLLQRVRDGGQLRDIKIGPNFTAGGYFYAVATADGAVIGSTRTPTPPASPPTARSTKLSLTGPPSSIRLRPRAKTFESM
jgi:hypothetical protein